MTLASDVQALAVGTICEFFVLDATAIGGTTYYFHPGVNSLSNDITWSNPINAGDAQVAQVYTRWPIDASGFEWNGKGQLPKPKIMVSNILGAISLINHQNNDLVGAKVIRKRTLLKYLDAVNFPGGVNPTADPTVAFSNDVYYVDRKSAENAIVCEYELSSSWDVQGKQLPGRQVIQNCCVWIYRGTECAFAGGAVADQSDTPTTVLANDVCGKRLSSCLLRFPSGIVMPFGGFPAAGLTKA